MASFLWFLLLACACLASPAFSQPKSIFILAGQSNMAGKGGVINETWDGVVPPQCQPNPAIFRFSEALKWEEAREPLHNDIDYNETSGVGPGLAFANMVLAREPSIGPMGLVPCAFGATKISLWARGTFLYNRMVNRASTSLQGGGTIKAVLWYQGESDRVNQEDADLYKNRLEKLFTDIRTDLQIPSVPIIQVALSSSHRPLNEKIREAQLGLDMANVKCIDAMGLELEPDYVHLTTPAQVHLGEMFADAFLQTQNWTQTQSTSSPVKSNAPLPTQAFTILFAIFSTSLLLSIIRCDFPLY